MLYKDRKRVYKNGYIVVEYPEHPRSFDTGTGIIGVYEHILIAEDYVLDRRLLAGEVVHHLDSNRENNSPNNLLVLYGPMHSKLHGWMRNQDIRPKQNELNKINAGCVRCAVCELPISYNKVFCSNTCKQIQENDVQYIEDRRFKTNWPSASELRELMWSKPTSKIAQELGVSDTAVAKHCKKLGIEKPSRGYWTKNPQSY